MESKQLLIEVKEVYGVRRFYPANEAAEIFARIAESTTLTERVLRQAEKLGYTVTERPRLQRVA